MSAPVSRRATRRCCGFATGRTARATRRCKASSAPVRRGALPDDAGEEEGWISTPVPTVMAFVTGLLRYLGLPYQ